MKTVSMSGSRRESVGKKDAKKHRQEGRVPCVIYGGKEEIHFVVEEKDLSKLLFTPETFFIKMSIDGSEHDCILKEVQYHPVSDHVLHADFMEFSGDKPITTSIPVKISGSAPGVMKGGQLLQKFRKLTLTAMPDEMPENIPVDVSGLDLNDKILVGEIKEDHFKIKERSDQILVTVRITRIAVTAGPEEEAAEEGEEEGKEAAEGEEGTTKEKEEAAE